MEENNKKPETIGEGLEQFARESGNALSLVKDKFAGAYNDWKKQQVEAAIRREADQKILTNPIYTKPHSEVTPEAKKEYDDAARRTVEESLHGIAAGAPVNLPKPIANFLATQAKKVLGPRLQGVLGAYDPKQYAKAREQLLNQENRIKQAHVAEAAGMKPNEDVYSLYESATSALGDELKRQHKVKDLDGVKEMLTKLYPDEIGALGHDLENFIVPNSEKAYYDIITKDLGKDHELVKKGSGGVFHTLQGMPKIIINPGAAPTAERLASVSAHEAQHLKDAMMTPTAHELTTNVFSNQRLINDLRQNPELAAKVLSDLERAGRQPPKNVDLADYLESLVPVDAARARNTLRAASMSKDEFGNTIASPRDRLVFHTKDHHVETPDNYELETLAKLLERLRR